MNTKSLNKVLALASVGLLLTACETFEWSATRIDQEVDKALAVFAEQIDGAEIFLNQSAGILVFPRALRAGFVIGAETGEGVMRIDGKTLTLQGEDGEASIDADTVILASGARGDRSLADTLRARGIETHIAGDCGELGYLQGAMHDGFRVGCSL